MRRFPEREPSRSNLFQLRTDTCENFLVPVLRLASPRIPASLHLLELPVLELISGENQMLRQSKQSDSRQRRPARFPELFWLKLGLHKQGFPKDLCHLIARFVYRHNKMFERESVFLRLERDTQMALRLRRDPLFLETQAKLMRCLRFVTNHLRTEQGYLRCLAGSFSHARVAFTHFHFCIHDRVYERT